MDHKSRVLRDFFYLLRCESSLREKTVQTSGVGGVLLAVETDELFGGMREDFVVFFFVDFVHRGCDGFGGKILGAKHVLDFDSSPALIREFVVHESVAIAVVVEIVFFV